MRSVQLLVSTREAFEWSVREPRGKGCVHDLFTTRIYLRQPQNGQKLQMLRMPACVQKKEGTHESWNHQWSPVETYLPTELVEEGWFESRAQAVPLLPRLLRNIQ